MTKDQKDLLIQQAMNFIADNEDSGKTLFETLVDFHLHILGQEKDNPAEAGKMMTAEEWLKDKTWPTRTRFYKEDLMKHMEHYAAYVSESLVINAEQQKKEKAWEILKVYSKKSHENAEKKGYKEPPYNEDRLRVWFEMKYNKQ